MSMTRTVGPVVEPVTLQEAKDELVIETSAYDAEITRKISAARETIEGYLGRSLVYQTWRTRLDHFPSGVIYLRRPPLVEVSSITYVDTAGDTQTLASSKYIVDTDSEPARIAPAYGETWPATRAQINAVTITSVHGYADGSASPLDLSAIPQKIKDAILVLVVELYQNREISVIGADRNVNDTIESLLWEHRVQSMAE